ncbi:MAG: sterol desaturase family protein [Ignavibacteriaceae bacterium]
MTKNFVTNKDVTIRMFKNDLMEFFSRVHPAVPLIIYVPVIFYFLFRSIFVAQFSYTSIIILILFGVFVWTLTEYSLHRFIFHHKFHSHFGERIHFIFHGVHHDYPMDSRRLVMPPSVSIPLAALFYYLFYLIFGPSLVAPFFVGFLTGYLFYDMTHYAVHHFNIHNKFWLAIKKHHIRHHFQDPDKGYGVSSPMWDKIIGTDFLTQEPDADEKL